MKTPNITPGPWTTTPGLFWICNVGNNPDDPGIWSEFPVKDGETFPFGDKAADATAIAAVPELIEALVSLVKLTPGCDCEDCTKAKAVLAKAGVEL